MSKKTVLTEVGQPCSPRLEHIHDRVLSFYSVPQCSKHLWYTSWGWARLPFDIHPPEAQEVIFDTGRGHAAGIHNVHHMVLAQSH